MRTRMHASPKIGALTAGLYLFTAYFLSNIFAKIIKIDSHQDTAIMFQKQVPFYLPDSSLCKTLTVLPCCKVTSPDFLFVYDCTVT